MKFLEKDLEQIIWEADKEMLSQRGLRLRGKLFRQFRVGNYGIIDLLEVQRVYDCPYCAYLSINIIELKQDKVGVSAFFQAIRYAKGIQYYLTNKRDFEKFKISITLIGSEIDKSGSLIYLPDLIGCDNNFGLLSCVDFYTYKYGLEGIEFQQECNYTLNNNGF